MTGKLLRRAIRERTALLKDEPLLYNGRSVAPGTVEHDRLVRSLAETLSTDEIRQMMGKDDANA